MRPISRAIFAYAEVLYFLTVIAKLPFSYSETQVYYFAAGVYRVMLISIYSRIAPDSIANTRNGQNER